MSDLKLLSEYPQPKLFGICCRVNLIDYDVPLHRHNYIEIEFLTKGRADHEINGFQNTLEVGSCMCLSPKDMHRHSPNGEVYILNICVTPRETPAAVRNLLGTLQLPMIGKLSPEQLSYVTDTYMRLKQELAEPSKHCEAKITAYMLIMISTLAEASVPLTETPVSSGYKHIVSAMDYINENFRKEITINEVASKIYLSKNYFSNLFTETVGCNFSDYITELRIDYAKNLLATTENEITQIALDCGFGSFASFSRNFKRLCGCTPSQYRARIL